MRITRHAARRWIFATGMTAALGFGGAQALAAPAPAARADNACDSRLCNRVCQALGSIGGFCTEPAGCSCYL